MKIQFTVIGIILTILVILSSFFVGKCSTQRERDRLNLTILEGKKQLIEDSITIANLKYKTFTQETTIISSERIVRELNDENAKLKALKVKNIQLIALLNAKVSALERQGQYVMTNVVHDTVQLWEEDQEPVSANYKDQWMTVNVEFKNKPIFNVLMNSIPLQITIADKKTGLFKTSPTVSIVDTPNPYVSIDKNDVVLIKKPKKFYSTQWFTALVTAGTCILLIK